MATILLVHGAWVGPWSLEHYRDAAAARGHDAHAVDLVPVARAAGSIAEHVDAVRGALDDHGEAVLWGQSLGGLVALHAAADPRARALVLQAASSPRGALDLPLAFQLAMWRYAPPILLGRPFGIRREDARRLFFAGVPEEAAEPALDRYTVASGRALRELVLGAGRIDAGSIGCPALVLTGEHDGVAPPPVQRRLAARLGAEYREVPGGGHSMGLAPGWERHADTVLDWIDATLGDRRRG